ncbi:MAG TPA: hypothetical protein VH740_15875 [Vicinamibacterales bacterium]|jgi:hypothetical protein
MTFSHFNRRTHLYLGLALLPWFFMYGLSSLPFAHSAYFDARDAAKKLPLWTLRADRTVDVPVPAAGADGQVDPKDLRAFGARLLQDAGISGTSFGAYRQSPNQINVYSHTFRKSTQLKYFVDSRRLTVEERRFRWDHFLTGMHARGGFEDERLFVRSWSVIVDIVSLAMIVWVASGLIMWWTLPGHRRWGLLTIAAGAISFLIFAATL